MYGASTQNYKTVCIKWPMAPAFPNHWRQNVLSWGMGFCWNRIETFFMFQTFIKKNKTFIFKLFFTVTNSVLPAISGPVFLQTSHYTINIVTGIINEPQKLWLADIVEFALSTFRTRNFITFLAWYFRGYCINRPALSWYTKIKYWFYWNFMSSHEKTNYYHQWFLVVKS